MINFSQKQRGIPGTRINDDVSVTYSKAHGENSNKTLRFSFSEKALRMICGEGRYAMVGLDDRYPERIYFAKSNHLNGYKLSLSSNNVRYSTVFGNDVQYKEPTSFIGYYALEYDASQGALYIDKNNKKEVK